MEILVHLTIALPHDMPEPQRKALYDIERERATRLQLDGILVRIWRDPGRTANWSLYNVDDPTHLHRVLSSLPLWPWMTVDVHLLAQHPAAIDTP